MKFLIFIFFIVFSYQVQASCELKTKSCRECIRDLNRCVWCAMENYNGSRCISKNKMPENWCSEEKTDPLSKIDIGKNENFTSATGKVIQIKPQEIKIDIRVGDSIDFDFSFKRAENYPVDLYFLLDGSISMKGLKDETANQSENIYRTMFNMTKDVYLGMGSFVDKNALPFTKFRNNGLAYSFRNRLQLKDDVEEFHKVLNETEFGENYDGQDGTLDALAQVIICPNIGWRKESRKIIVVLTESPYHTTGDGKWAGILKPYDGKCYTINREYTQELEMDYPSVGIINKLVADKEIIIIFAVKNNVKTEYQVLNRVISGSKTAEYEGSGMATILKDLYKEITDYIKLKVIYPTGHRKYFHLSFYPNCYNTKENNINCRIKQGEEKKIKGTIKLLDYIDTENIEISIVFESIKEKLKLDVNIIKECDCKRDSTETSPACSNKGRTRCGICECDPNRSGQKCECALNTGDSNQDDNSACIAPNATELCSGRGSCSCGYCSCGKGYHGTYCECSENSCSRVDGLVCSGPDNAECYCGKCNCKPGWTGALCDCSTSTENCFDGDKKCNNRGEDVCRCNKCECPDVPDWDARSKQDAFCKSSCPEENCHSRQCLNLEQIALCHLNGNDCPSYTNLNITLVKNITNLYLDGTWRECNKIRVDVGCYTEVVYKYIKDQYGIDIIVQSEVNCAESYFVYGGICLGVLILIGLATLIAWKCLTEIRDRREYSRFMQQISETGYSQDNNIYQQPTTTFYNPAFRKRSINSNH